MSKFFREVIFPVKIKEAVSLVSSERDNRGMLIFDTIWCKPKGGWVSLVECIDCNIGIKTFREILEDESGCE